MSTMNVLDAAGSTVAVEKPLVPGQAVMAASRPVVIASDQSAVSITSTLLPSSLGTKLAAASLAVTLASDGPLTTVSGTTSDAAVANGSGGTIAGYLRSIKDAATDTTTQSPVKVLTYTANSKYKAIAASQTAAVIGATGATGDYLSHVLIIPATTSPGAVSITDGSGSAITVFAGGASSVTNLVPFAVPVGAVSTTGAWKATTGTNVSIIGFGNLT